MKAKLWWQVVHAIDEDYTLFLHAVDESGRISGQIDLLLSDGESGTSEWRVGKIVSQDVELGLDPLTPPGRYTLKLGLYDWRTGDRLPVWDKDGYPAADDSITILSIMIAE